MVKRLALDDQTPPTFVKRYGLVSIDFFVMHRGFETRGRQETCPAMENASSKEQAVAIYQSRFNNFNAGQ